MSGRKIINGLHEAIAHARGDHSVARVRVVRVPEQVDVKAIRQQLNLSQTDFARRFGFSLDALQNWERIEGDPDFGQTGPLPAAHLRAWLKLVLLAFVPLLSRRKGATVETAWSEVGPGTPVGAWLETKREGEEGTNICACRILRIGDEPEWVEKTTGRTTITHHSFAAPTHWRWPHGTI